MKQELKENQGLPASLLWTLAIIAGISVANLYYNQPLLNRISRDLQTSEFTANLIAMITQIGYAIGLLFIIPLGDLFKRKTIILINFTVLVVSLLTIALTPYIHLILLPLSDRHLFGDATNLYPHSCTILHPKPKEENVGMIVSGLLTGILASRVVSGIIGEYLGWRFIFFVAAGMMVICVIIIMRVLPDMPCNFKGRYSDLMKSLFSLVMEYPQLRISSLRAGIAFGSFLALWTSLAFKMEQAPFFAGNNIVGLLGLCGIAGALTASYIGNYVQVLGVKRLNYIGCGLIFAAWFSLYSGQNSYVGIIIGIFIIDIGMQCIQLSNQTTIFSLNPKAANRINTIFMTTYFIGGSIGTLLAGIFWHWFGWQGVVGTGITLATCSFMINIFSKK